MNDNEVMQQAEPVAHSVIAGALFDFMGWLTTREERLVLSSTDNASPAADAIKHFAEMRDLSLDDAKVKDWKAYTDPPQQQAEPVHGDIRALKYRIHELEGEVLGYKRMLDVAEAASQPQQQAEPVMLNGLTEAETNATASVLGLTKQAEPAYDEGYKAGWSDAQRKQQAELLFTTPPQQQAEPVATMKMLHTYGNAPPQRKPLTDEQRNWIVATCPTPRHIIDAIEAAHGIKEGT